MQNKLLQSCPYFGWMANNAKQQLQQWPSVLKLHTVKISRTPAFLLGVSPIIYCNHVIFDSHTKSACVWDEQTQHCVIILKKKESSRKPSATVDTEHHCQPATVNTASETLHNGVCHSPKPYAITDGAHLSRHTHTHTRTSKRRAIKWKWSCRSVGKVGRIRERGRGASQRGGAGGGEGEAARLTSSPPSVQPSPFNSSSPRSEVTQQGSGGGVNFGQVAHHMIQSPPSTFIPRSNIEEWQHQRLIATFIHFSPFLIIKQRKSKQQP